ncbi:hypothetical protein AB0F81_42780 [Actinoplanes sp. NPDC024001]|uniref:hypothetical protein n=1 Tax=Actinoplanes sp. NPDC024001 TaxID=3154598 RepID=UPI0033E496D1
MRASARGPFQPSPVTVIGDGSSEVVLLDAVSRGSVPAFLALVDRTSAAVRAVLAEIPPGHGRNEILAASYLEVWWLAGCHLEADLDVTAWITGIARRRVADAGIDPPAQGERLGPGYAELEFAALFRRPVGDPLWE